jgi:hypothetical protein
MVKSRRVYPHMNVTLTRAQVHGSVQAVMTSSESARAVLSILVMQLDLKWLQEQTVVIAIITRKGSPATTAYNAL